MNNNIGRYELKYVLNEYHYTSSMLWLNEIAIRRTYPDRYVNSLYFDDVSYQSVRDNLAGISERRKMRLRWYSNEDQIITDEPNLELKYRNGRLGNKVNYKLSGFKDELLDMEFKDVMPKIKINLQDAYTTTVILDDHYTPTLYVSYRRKYLEDYHGLRITIDKDINFYHPHPCLKMSQAKLMRYPHYIMELKFPIELKNTVAEMIRKLHLTPKRHSKYLVGLAMLGTVQYI